MKEINKVVKNFLYMGVSNVVSQITAFLMVVYYARILGKEYFGSYTTASAIIMYFSMVMFLGLQTYGIREVSKNSSNAGKLTADIIFLRVTSAVLCIILLDVISLTLIKDIILKNIILLYSLALIPSAMNVDWVFVGLQRMEYNAIYNILRSLVPAVLVFILLRDKNQIMLIPLSILISFILGVIYQCYIYVVKLKIKLKIHITLNKSINYLTYGFPFMLSGILATINTNVDRIVINFTRGAGEAGLYSSGYNIILFLTTVVSVFFIPVFPLLVKHFNDKDNEKLNALCVNMMKIMMMIGIPVCLGGVLLSKEIILLLFGQEYELGYLSFRILMIFIVMFFIREVYGYGLNAWNMEKRYLRIVGISSLTNLTLNLILTPYFGMNAAACVTVASEVINLLLMRKYANKIMKFNELNFIPKLIFPNAVMGATILYLKCMGISTILNILISSIVYFIIIFGTKYVGIREVEDMIIKRNEY